MTTGAARIGPVLTRERSRRRAAARRLLAGTAALLPAAVVAALVLAAVATAVVPRVVGGVPLAVLSGSMEPTLSAGDLVVVRPVEAADLRVGEVVTFQPVSADPTLVTHRVVAIERVDGEVTAVVTRGDANDASDEPLLPEQVRGRVLYSVPLVGHLTRSPWVRTAAIAGITALVVRALWAAAASRSASREEATHVQK